MRLSPFFSLLVSVPYMFVECRNYRSVFASHFLPSNSVVIPYCRCGDVVVVVRLLDECALVQFQSTTTAATNRSEHGHIKFNHRYDRYLTIMILDVVDVSYGPGGVVELVLWFGLPVNTVYISRTTLNHSSYAGDAFSRTAPCCNDIMVSEYTHLSAAYDIFAQRPNASNASTSTPIQKTYGNNYCSSNSTKIGPKNKDCRNT